MVRIILKIYFGLTFFHFFVISGFDPWDESSKALADLIEKETNINSYLNNVHGLPEQSRPKNLPPGFSSNHIGAYTVNPSRTGSRHIHNLKL